jgi:hypothetical protein
MAYNFRKDAPSQPKEPEYALLKFSTGEYSIVVAKSCRKYKGQAIENLNQAKLVKQGYGEKKVVGEIVKYGTDVELKSYLSENCLALPSDKENTPPSKNTLIKTFLILRLFF